MEFFKDFFNDDKQIVGLCAFKKQQDECFQFTFQQQKPKTTRFLYETNTSQNFFLR